MTKSERAASRVMKSVSSWLERKLFLKTSPAKRHVCRPSQSQFPGFGFWNSKGEWKAKPDNSRKMRLYDKIRKILCRKKAGARPLSAIFKKVNQAAQGWINYFFIGSMKGFMTKFGQWLRHKIRVIILKQWKRPRIIYKNLMKLCKLIPGGFDPELIRLTKFGQWLRHKIRVIILKQWKRPRIIYKNLMKLCKLIPGGFDPELIRQTANSRLGLYRTAGMSAMNFLLSRIIYKNLMKLCKLIPGGFDPELIRQTANSRLGLYRTAGMSAMNFLLSPKVYKNLMKLCKLIPGGFDPELIRQTANSRLGLYRTAGMSAMNFLLSPKVLETGKGERPGLVNPLKYYLSKTKA